MSYVVLTKAEFEAIPRFLCSLPTYSTPSKAPSEVSPWLRISKQRRQWLLCRYEIDGDNLIVQTHTVVLVPNGTSVRWDPGFFGGVWVMSKGPRLAIGADPVFCARHMWRSVRSRS